MEEEPLTLQGRLNKQIDIASARRGRRYTDREIGDSVGCAHTVIYNLRHGHRHDTQSHILSAVEDLLGAAPGYLTKWATQRDPNALQVALRALELSPAGIAAVQDFLTQIERLEAAGRTGTDRETTKDIDR